MDRIKFIIFVGLVLALFVLFDMDVSAEELVCNDTITHPTITSPTIWATDDLGLNSYTSTFDLSVNYKLPTKGTLSAKNYYFTVIYLNAVENVYTNDSTGLSKCLFRYYILYAGQKYYFNSNGSDLSLVLKGNGYDEIAVGCEFSLSASSFYADASNMEPCYISGSTTIKTFTRFWKLDSSEVVDLALLDSLNNSVNIQGSSITSKLDELKQALTRDYDASGAEAANTELSGSLGSMSTAEGVAMGDAKVYVGNYDTASAFKFVPALVSSLSFLTTFANGFFTASGDLSTALTVMTALVFVSCVVGLIKFVK